MVYERMLGAADVAAGSSGEAVPAASPRQAGPLWPVALPSDLDRCDEYCIPFFPFMPRPKVNQKAHRLSAQPTLLTRWRTYGQV